MRPKWAAREGREAAAHSLTQPFLVPLEANGMPVAGAEITPLGEYAPVTPHYTNPLAQFIPNVTYVEDGNDVVGFGGPADAVEEVAAEEAEEAEEKMGEEPVTSEEKELDIMKSALRQVAAKRGNVKDLVARLESSEAREVRILSVPLRLCQKSLCCSSRVSLKSCVAFIAQSEIPVLLV